MSPASPAHARHGGRSALRTALLLGLLALGNASASAADPGQIAPLTPAPLTPAPLTPAPPAPLRLELPPMPIKPIDTHAAQPGMGGQAPSSPSSSSSGPLLGWEELRARVLLHNPELHAMREQVRAARSGIRTASAWPNPELEAATGYQRRRMPEGIPGPTASYGVSWRIENPGLRQARISGARLASEASTAGFEVLANDVIAQAHERLYQYVLRLDEIRAAQDALALLEQIRERVAVRVQTGEGPRFELLRADAEAGAARQRVDVARIRAEQARIALIVLAGDGLPEHFRVKADLSDVAAGTTRSVPTEGLNPELRRLEYEWQRAQARITQERNSLLPNVTMRVTQVQDPDVRGTQAGLSLQIPLLDRRAGPIGEAQADAERIRHQLDGRRITLAQQSRAAQQSLELAQRSIVALETGVLVQANSALRVAETAYRFGERGLLEVLDAQRTVRNTQLELLQARYELQAAAIELERLRGAYAVSLDQLPPQPPLQPILR